MGDILELMLIIVIISALAFVFQGEPDIWDKWHAAAMGTSCPPVTASPAQKGGEE